MSKTTQQNASSSEELAATAEEMSTQAEQLQQAMSFFKLANTPSAGAAAPQRARNRLAPAPRNAVKTPGHGALAFATDAADESNFTRF